jgi:hypothetical protein
MEKSSTRIVNTPILDQQSTLFTPYQALFQQPGSRCTLFLLSGLVP